MASSNNTNNHYALRIVVLTFNRAASLLRLLNSINEAVYYSDAIKLEVWIDRSEDGLVDNLTTKTAQEFVFKYGVYDVIVRQQHAGIYGQWLTSWKPIKNMSEIAVILEDDLTVSPYFYKYLKAVHRKYDNIPEVNGYALQGYSIKHHITDNTVLDGPAGSLVYLYPVLGTWGFSPVTNNWIEFLKWFYSLRGRTNIQPYVPGNIASNWYIFFQRQRKADSMWEMWHIYYAWLNKEFTLYSNFPGHAGLSNSWREAGLHYTSNEGPSNKLLTEWKAEYDNLPERPLHVDIAGKLLMNSTNESIKRQFWKNKRIPSV
ncbi:uncharacterized protein LOC123539971 [Mercenaria mercenaria]|uniref:uncharacterized protein LOC123539971 n=1 Tax=Mercenaria mercenaria TaxID=6596 RepID=UPI00234EB74E|nr:uncharacterized protein LOC123539971 [Mercenaria mercenaria]